MSIKFLHRVKFFFSPLGVGGLLFLLPTTNCLLPTFSCKAQTDVIKYAHQIIDTLCSPSMHGRGYVNKGDSIAADYIKKEFEKCGLKPLGKEFYQRFTFDVNTFPDNISLSINGKPLRAGKDFIAESYSDGCKGSAKIIFINKKVIKHSGFVKKISKKSLSYTAFLLDTTGVSINDLFPILDRINDADHTPFIYIEKKKFTSNVTINESVGCYFSVLEKSLPKKPKKITYEIKAKFIPNYQSQNVLGCIKGTQYPDSFIVFSAHYDHLGRMGKDVYFPGANDNASGCAMLLNFAKYYSQHPQKYSIAFFAFGAEEAGLLGSKYYVEQPLFPLKQIKFLVNMDIMGTGDEGIKVVNATEHKKEFDELVKINSEKNLLPVVSPRGKAANSDHYYFEEAGVKTFFIYTLGGIKAYHDVYDRPETLPLTKFEQVYNLLLQFTDYLQK